MRKGTLILYGLMRPHLLETLPCLSGRCQVTEKGIAVLLAGLTCSEHAEEDADLAWLDAIPHSMTGS